MESGWMVLFTTDDPLRAELVKETLENSDIEAVIMNKKDSTYLVAGEVEVMVMDKNFEQAKKLIKVFESE